jgi:hypothetical protein
MLAKSSFFVGEDGSEWEICFSDSVLAVVAFTVIIENFLEKLSALFDCNFKQLRMSAYDVQKLIKTLNKFKFLKILTSDFETIPLQP